MPNSIPGYTLRPLVAADEAFLWEMLYHAVYVGDGPPPPRDIVQQPELAAYVQGWGRPDDGGYAAVTDPGGQPVGAVWLRCWPGAYKGYGYVDDPTPELSAALLPGHRGRGLGTRLLTATLETARERYPGVSLSVSQGTPARRLYERLGFEVVTTRGDSLVMRLRFDSPTG